MIKSKELIIKCGLYFYLAIMTIIVSYFSSKVWNILWPNERFTVVTVSSMSFLILLLGLSIKLKKIQHIFIIYHVSVILTVLLMLVSYEYRPIMAIFMLITLFAGLDTGIISVVSISVAVSFLFGAEQEYLYGTIIIGTISCLVAYFVKDKMKFIISIIIFLFSTFFINGIFQYLNNADVFDYKFALLSLSSAIISIIILFNVYLLIKPKSVEPYIKEDSETIKSIREKSLTLFYHSTEVAELSSAGAKAIKCNERLTFGGGLLHDLGKVEGNSDYIKSGLKLANYYGIPKEIKAIMVEHNAKNRIPGSKESAIVMLADTVISSIEYLKASNKEVSEKKIIENVFNARLNSNTLDNSGLSLKEYMMIKKAFLDFY